MDKEKKGKLISDPEKIKALGLCSGGLDSMLAGLVLRREGLEVEWVTFETPFFSSAKARKASRMTGIPLTVINFTSTYLKMLKNPPRGYGQHMNPCMDCHALMFRNAGKIMEQRGFDFLFSGEVLGQRPMSQTKPSLRYVEKTSGYDGYIVRPLSARRLPATIPEREGLIKRDALLDFAGRSRKPQIKLAMEFGIVDFPTPAGGCLLTDGAFSSRLKDYFDHQEVYSERALELLKYGRHFRLDDETKVIVGRTQKDNENILKHHDPEHDTIIEVEGYPGPIVLIPGGGQADCVPRAAAMCVGYSKAPNDRQNKVEVVTPQGRETIMAKGVPPAEVRDYLVSIHK